MTQRINVYTSCVFHSLTTFILTVTPREPLDLSEQRQCSEKSTAKAKTEIFMFAEPALFFFYQQTKTRNTTTKANEDRQGTRYIVPWVKNFPRHRLTIEFMIERDRGC